MRRLILTLLACVVPADLMAAQLKVCASGCPYTNAQLQTALNVAVCGDEVLLQGGMTYNGTFTVTVRCTSGTWDRITVRTGVDATGNVLADSVFPAPNVRITTAYTPVVATLRPNVNNSPAIRTVWPAETGNGCASAPCVPDGWSFKWLAFASNPTWYSRALLQLGSNAAPSDVTAGDSQNTVAEAPRYLTVTQCIFYGDPYIGQHQALYLSSADTRVTLNSFTDIKSGSETQAITEVNGVGPYLIENNLIQATGENFLFGGGDSQMQRSTTITGSPTAMSITLAATTELYDQEFITVTVAADGKQYSGIVCTLTGSTCALSPSLPVTPSAGDTVKWTRLAGGITIRLNDISKPLEWFDDIVPAPTGVAVVCSTTGGTLAAGTYYYRVSGRRNMYANYDGADAWSLATAQVSGTVASGSTGSCVVTFTESVQNTLGTRVYGRANNSATQYWQVSDGVATYTDTGSAGTTETAPNTGATWVIKNGGEFKHAAGHSPSGPNLVEGNIFSYSKCCSQNMLLSAKVWDQDGGDVGSDVGELTIRYNWLKHGVRCLNFTTTHAENQPSGYMRDVLVENNLCTDLSTVYGGSYTPIQITSGNYPNHVGSRGGQRITIQHNTILPDTAMDGPLWFVMTAAGDTNRDLVYRNNINGLQGSLALRTYINDAGQTVGTTSWNAAVSGTSVASHNVWPDASSGTYTFSTSSHFPTNATLRGSLVSYASCYADVITACALNGSSTYDAAASDGLDIGADIPAIKALTDIALSGINSTGSGGSSSGTIPRIRLRIRGGL